MYLCAPLSPPWIAIVQNYGFRFARSIAEHTKKVGQTRLRHLVYCFLGDFNGGLDATHPQSIVILLAKRPPQILTFTYPDSTGSLPFATKLEHRAYRKPDHGQVYTLDEIKQVVAEFGMPAATAASGSSFLVSQSRQECWVFWGDRVIRTWLCSTGYGQWTTRIGSFAVQSKIEVAESNGYRLDMPYWLGIYDVDQAENGIYGLPIDWDTGERSGKA